ncbi:hypothetical protein VT84_07160 [Gemmata sp. SH-PL17]|nr:hypothetical protein VT84_07160 [Gemmata sp. SH-PL17]
MLTFPDVRAGAIAATTNLTTTWHETIASNHSKQANIR